MTLPIKYISFDPGKTTGICEWDETGTPVSVPRDLTEEGLEDYLLGTPTSVEKFIYEKWTLWKSRNRQGDKLVTVQAIGKIRLTARKHQIELVEQDPGIRVVAALWSGIKYPEGHMENWLSAYLHGYYHLHTKGIIPPRVLKNK